MARRIGDLWFTIVPAPFLAALVPLSLVNLATHQRFLLWLTSSESGSLFFVLAICTYNLSVFYSCWRIWWLPLASRTRLQIIGWMWFWGPAAIPAWRRILIPALIQSPNALEGTNPIGFGIKLRRFYGICLRTMIVYLIILSCGLTGVQISLSQQPGVRAASHQPCATACCADSQFNSSL